MNISDSVLQPGERITLTLRQLYLSHGYRPYRMSKFEEYDFYAGNKDFLVSDNVITFTDTDGKLMALKPDVTLSIIKNSADAPNAVQKVFYDENVYRVSDSTGSFQEILQTGVECFGKVGEDEICETLTLAAESLQALSADAVITVSDLDILSEILIRMRPDSDRKRRLYRAIGAKNPHEIGQCCEECGHPETAGLLSELLSLHGTPAEVLPRLDGLLLPRGGESYPRFRHLIDRLCENPWASALRIDFAVTGDENYYNGIVFKGFVRDVPTAVLSGGQYDPLMARLGRKSRAVGFAVYTDALERLDLSAPVGGTPEDPFVNVALPKGRLGEKVYAMFAAAGYECPSILEPNRKLIFENPATGIRYFWVKPSDVPIYVERGAADIGVAGKDILLEYEPKVYELLDLQKGKCRMAVAGPAGYTDDPTRTLRVATKFAHIAKQYYRTLGRDIDIIHLNGSIEIAPILGLSDVIVDIVETGSTLRENNLEVLDTILPISARLISNQAAYKFKAERIKAITEKLAAIVTQ